MTFDEYVILNEAIDSVITKKGSNQYYEGKDCIEGTGINILRILIKGMIDDDE